ncbi:MAG: copper chaperone PCu(A)C [Ramlibacter sp.]|nr:copper chaperone PCu(A)C [Ramlibacter sp.]
MNISRSYREEIIPASSVRPGRREAATLLVSGVDLPAGKDVALQPGGGYHIMLLDLKEQVHAGSQVPVTLVFEGADGRKEAVEIQATARVLNATSD